MAGRCARVYLIAIVLCLDQTLFTTVQDVEGQFHGYLYQVPSKQLTTFGEPGKVIATVEPSSETSSLTADENVTISNESTTAKTSGLEIKTAAHRGYVYGKPKLQLEIEENATIVSKTMQK